MLEVTGQARRDEAEVLRLITENTGLLRFNNKLGEENFKLKDAAAQLARQLEVEQVKRKEAEESFAQAIEELEKKSADLKMLEDNYGEAYDNGYDTCSRDFKEQIPGVT